MKYIDLSKLQTSPYSAITNVVALDENGDIIKAENINIENELTDYPTTEEVNATLENYVTKEELQNDYNVIGELIPQPQLTGTTATADSKQYVYCGDKTDRTNVVSQIFNNSKGANSYSLAVTSWGKYQSNGSSLLYFDMATSTTAGMMSADMYNKLMNLNSGDTATKVVWGESSNINSYTTAGVYDISGERRNANDNLPILNSNPGHTISARLYVLDSSINGTGVDTDKCITQVLMLSNRVGGDGNLYVRTGRGSSISNLSWEQWGTLQQNINVGTITSYDNLIDNGIYSGVYTNGSTIFDTFVMVVINNYAVAGQVGAERTVSQFLYVTHIDGSVEFLRRASLISQYDGSLRWYKWKGLFNDSQYIYNLPTAPDMGKITKQVIYYEHTDFTVPSGALNNLFYNHIKNLISSNSYKVEVFAEMAEYNSYNNTSGLIGKIIAEIYCYDSSYNFKKFQKIWVNGNKGVKIIQDLDIQ